MVIFQKIYDPSSGVKKFGNEHQMCRKTTTPKYGQINPQG
jgi:hypothetical protein